MFDIAVESLGEIVREKRKLLGLTQGKLATAIGVTPQTINNLEMGKTQTLKTGKLGRLAEALEMQLPELLMHVYQQPNEVGKVRLFLPTPFARWLDAQTQRHSASKDQISLAIVSFFESVPPEKFAAHIGPIYSPGGAPSEPPESPLEARAPPDREPLDTPELDQPGARPDQSK